MLLRVEGVTPVQTIMLLYVYVSNGATTCGHFDEMTERYHMDPLIYGKSKYPA
jgi:hypothetical protein